MARGVPLSMRRICPEYLDAYLYDRAEAEKASTRKLRGSGSRKELLDVPEAHRRAASRMSRLATLVTRRHAQWQKRPLSARTIYPPHESPGLLSLPTVQDPAATSWM